MDRSDKITFKDYIYLSRQQLIEALKGTPKQRFIYEIDEYCRLTIGESLESKETVALKPGQQLSVLWEYHDGTPNPISVRFFDVKNLDSAVEHDLYWNSTQLSKWLDKNTKQ